MTEDNKDTKQPTNEAEIYEIGFHIAPVLDEERVGGIVASLKEEMSKAGVEFISEGYPSKIKLAYEISGDVGGEKRSFDSAYFGWVKFSVSPEALPGITKLAESNTQILRHLIVKTIKEDTMPPKKEELKPEESQTVQRDTRPIKKEEPRELSDDEKKAIDESIEELVSE